MRSTTLGTRSQLRSSRLTSDSVFSWGSIVFQLWMTTGAQTSPSATPPLLTGFPGIVSGRSLVIFTNSTLQPKGSPRYDRLGKVRPVIDHLSKQFADLYEPHKEVAVDEAMIKFTGQSAVKQYNMPMNKQGI